MPLSLNQRDVTLIAVGLAVTLLGMYVAHNEAGGQDAPRAEYSNPNLGYVIDSLANDGGQGHYFHPRHCVPGQDVVWLPHRYPSNPGGNISTLVTYGLGVLSKPAPQDDDWRVGAPAEQAWLCVRIRASAEVGESKP